MKPTTRRTLFRAALGAVCPAALSVAQAAPTSRYQLTVRTAGYLPDGQFSLTFADGSAWTFAPGAVASGIAGNTPGVPGTPFAPFAYLLLACWKAHDPTLTHPGLLVGKTITWDPSRPGELVRVSG